MQWKQAASALCHLCWKGKDGSVGRLGDYRKSFERSQLLPYTAQVLTTPGLGLEFSDLQSYMSFLICISSLL